MKIICWNVNSIKQRISHLEQLIKDEKPDLILLQELKCEEDKFPYLEFEGLGYNYVISGQKTFNGVAIFSKYPIEESIKTLPSYGLDDNDEQARYVEILVTAENQVWRIISVYVPNGQEVGSDKFQYKMKYYQRLEQHLNELQSYGENLVIAGDFNVANEDIDIYDPKKLGESICCSAFEKKALRSFMSVGLFDSFRIHKPDTANFSWWDYRGGAYDHNKGLRIDYIFANSKAMNMLRETDILEKYRSLEKPSDHAPIMAKFKTA